MGQADWKGAGPKVLEEGAKIIKMKKICLVIFFFLRSGGGGAWAPSSPLGPTYNIHYQIKVHRLNKPIFRKLNYTYQTEV